MTTITRTTTTAGAVALALTLAACGGGDGTTAGETTAPETTAGEAATTASFNDADVAFAQQMIVHHRGALEMSELAVEKTQNAEVRALAERVISAQQPEIDTMTGWLEEWGRDVPQGTSLEGVEMPGMEGMDMGTMPMPGQMSEEQMDEMAGMSGPEFDRMFLESMVEHHRGAIEMAEAQLQDGENAEALALAEDVVAAQTAEIEEIEQLLATL
ncbi:DUF305 domain-containing protein [Kineosporiaceae bacterium SCSIO 59966]|nr:DUF305 domain-containing protein [Kineosporiaceae bacterium SCSIO 59966]